MTNDTLVNLHISSARTYPASVSAWIVNDTALTSVIWEKTVDYCDNTNKYAIHTPYLNLPKLIYVLLLICLFPEFGSGILIAKRLKNEYTLWTKSVEGFLRRTVSESHHFFQYFICNFQKHWIQNKTSKGDYLSPYKLLGFFLNKSKITEFLYVS